MANRVYSARHSPFPTFLTIAEIDWKPSDRLVAANFPAWALGQGGQGTTVGTLINSGLVLALMFWPSEDEEGPAFREISRKPEPRRSEAKSVTPERIARATGAEFGRRGP